MKLVIRRATILKVTDSHYQVFDDGELVGTFYNKKDAKEFADMLNEMHNNH